MSGLVSEFDERGFVVLDGLLREYAAEDKRQLERLLADLAGQGQQDWNRPGVVLSPPGSATEGRVQKVQGLCQLAPQFLAIFKRPEVVEALGALAGHSEMDFFGTKLFPMYPGGTSVHWHQDNHYFGTASPHIISVGIYLEATDAENGALRAVPGSHKEGQVEHVPGAGDFANGEWAVVEEARAVDVCCTPGTVVLFNALLLHAARPNTSVDRTRFSVFGHFVPKGLDFAWRGEDFSSGKYADRHPL